MTPGLPGASPWGRMRELLGPEAPAFLDSYRRPAPAGGPDLLGVDPAALPGLLGIPPDPVPWCREACFLPEDVRVGRTVAHAAGLATCRSRRPWPSGSPGRAAGPAGAPTWPPPRRQGDPGRGRLGGAGVVVANEVQRGSRVQVLADNSTAGARGGRCWPARPWPAWPNGSRGVRPGAARRPLLGRGPVQARSRGRRPVASRPRPGQRRTPARPARRRRPPGPPGRRAAYATCTFAPEENEHQVAGFLATHAGLGVLDIPHHPGFTPGRPDWTPGTPPTWPAPSASGPTTSAARATSSPSWVAPANPGRNWGAVLHPCPAGGGARSPGPYLTRGGGSRPTRWRKSRRGGGGGGAGLQRSRRGGGGRGRAAGPAGAAARLRGRGGSSRPTRWPWP